MYFEYPFLLWGLLAIIIPIVIHLFSFRRTKKIYFSNTYFLQSIKKKNYAIRTIRHLFTLFFRILAILFIVLAFAQPILKPNQATPIKNKLVTIYVDNSQSMLLGVGSSSLERAKKKAKQLIYAYAPHTKFIVLTCDLEGKHQRVVGKEQAEIFIDDIKSSAHTISFKTLLQKQEDIGHRYMSWDKEVYLLSDFQVNNGGIEKIDTITERYPIYLLPIETRERSNIYIDSIWQFKENTDDLSFIRAVVKVCNELDKPIKQLPLVFKQFDKTKKVHKISIRSKDCILDTLILTTKTSKWTAASVSIKDYPLSFDNQYYFGLGDTRVSQIGVYSNGGINKHIRLVYADKNKFKLDMLSPSFKKDIYEYDLIVIDHLKEISLRGIKKIQSFVEQGGKLLIIPNKQADISSYNRLLKSLDISALKKGGNTDTYIDFIHTDSDVYKGVFKSLPEDVDLPRVYNQFAFEKELQLDEEVLLATREGVSFLSQFQIGKGLVYVLMAPLSQKSTDFPIHAIYPPFMYKLAIKKAKESDFFHHTIGAQGPIRIPLDQYVFDQEQPLIKLKSMEQDKVYIPMQNIQGNVLSFGLPSEINHQGLYVLEHKLKDTIGFLGLNYNRRESIMDFLSIEELQSFAQKSTGIHILNMNIESRIDEINRLYKGASLWKLCIIFALMCLAAETFLLRYYGH